MSSLIKQIEKNATKYDNSTENLKEGFIDVCNKDNELGKQYIDSLMKYFDMSVKCFEEHQKLMDSLASVKPIKQIDE